MQIYRTIWAYGHLIPEKLGAGWELPIKGRPSHQILHLSEDPDITEATEQTRSHSCWGIAGFLAGQSCKHPKVPQWHFHVGYLHIGALKLHPPSLEIPTIRLCPELCAGPGCPSCHT